MFSVFLGENNSAKSGFELSSLSLSLSSFELPAQTLTPLFAYLEPDHVFVGLGVNRRVCPSAKFCSLSPVSVASAHDWRRTQVLVFLPTTWPTSLPDASGEIMASRRGVHANHHLRTRRSPRTGAPWNGPSVSLCNKEPSPPPSLPHSLPPSLPPSLSVPHYLAQFGSLKSIRSCITHFS